jgi:hypothetical protein
MPPSEVGLRRSQWKKHASRRAVANAHWSEGGGRETGGAVFLPFRLNEGEVSLKRSL